VAASKFKTANLRMDNFRPYASKLKEVIDSLINRLEGAVHPLLEVREVKKVWILCMTSDRGLCGGFNNNVIKTTERVIKQFEREGKEITMIPIGKKGRDYFRKKVPLRDERTDIMKKFDMETASQIAKILEEAFISGEYDELYLIYNEFRNVAVQRPVVLKVLPLPFAPHQEGLSFEKRINYIYEPAEADLLGKLLPLYMNVMIFRALLETSAGEHGARMVAMDNAKRNCEEMIDRLTLKFNKVRQAAITAELMDIVGGTEALAKG